MWRLLSLVAAVLLSGPHVAVVRGLLHCTQLGLRPINQAMVLFSFNFLVSHFSCNKLTCQGSIDLALLQMWRSSHINRLHKLLYVSHNFMYAIHRQDVEVKNADGKKTSTDTTSTEEVQTGTNPRMEKCKLGQNREDKKRRHSILCPIRRLLYSTLIPVDVFCLSTFCLVRRLLPSSYVLSSLFTIRRFVLSTLFTIRRFPLRPFVPFDKLSVNVFYRRHF
jgi:hypothetical protein